jgi:SHS2 domain-containing protein
MNVDEHSQDAPQSQDPAWLEPLDHTADLGIRVQASDLKGLFARAAWGMFSLITDVPSVRPLVITSIHVEANDSQALLVKWLSELNFRHVTQRQVFCQFDILELDERRLTAEVRGEKIDLDRHTVYTEVKAVTFHELRLEKQNEVWTAQVIFDV